MNAQEGFAKVPIHEVQDYWNRRPCNIRHSPKEIGTREYFDEVATRKYFVESHLPDWAQYERWRGKKVLEIGCGIGTDTTTFAQHGAHVTAVDVSEESLKIARQRARVYGLEGRCRFYNANAEDLSSVVPIEKYDLVYSYGVIHHTPHPERILREIAKYVDSDSKVQIMVYNRRSWKVFWIVAKFGRGRFWRLSRLVANHSEAQTGCPVTYTYSRKAGRKLLERNGLEVTEERVDHIFPYRIPDYARHEYVKVWYFRFLPRPIFRGLERLLGWHLLLTAKPHEAEQKFAGGGG